MFDYIPFPVSDPALSWGNYVIWLANIRNKQPEYITKPAKAPPHIQQPYTKPCRYRRPETQPTTNFASYPLQYWRFYTNTYRSTWSWKILKQKQTPLEKERMSMVKVKVIPITICTNGNNLFNYKCSFHKTIIQCVSGARHDLPQWAIRCLAVVTLIIFVIPNVPSILKDNI